MAVHPGADHAGPVKLNVKLTIKKAVMFDGFLVFKFGAL